MALPTILVNSATGSDSAASGAGPATALSGTAGSTDVTGFIVSLDGSPDLSGVATDGSAVLFFNQGSTASSPCFITINAVDNTAKTVTVDVNVGAGATNVPWGIGGKRASIGGADSKTLFDRNSGAGDALPGWTIEMESGHTETITATMTLRRNGDATSGHITLKGTSGAATPPVVTFSNNGVGFGLTVNPTEFITLRDFEIRNSNATKTASIAVSEGSNNKACFLINLKIAHATNYFWKGISGGGSGASGLHVYDSEIGYTASDGISAGANSTNTIVNCRVHDCGGVGINNGNSSRIIRDCEIWGCTGDGIQIPNLGSSLVQQVVDRCTIHDCGGDGIQVELTGANYATIEHVQITNCILSSCGGYGINFTGASMSAIIWNTANRMVRNNNTYNNTSGACNLSGVLKDDPGLDPQFTDAANGDFTIGTNLREQGFPESNRPGASYRTYADIGANQHQDAGGGGLTIPVLGRIVG